MKKLLLLITGLLLLFSVEGQILRYSNYTTPVPPTPETNDFLTNLVAYWKLDEASGTLADSQGSNDATTTTADYDSTGISGKCMHFTLANSDFLVMTDAAALQMYDQDFTFAAWVYLKSEGTTATYAGIIGGETNSASMTLYGSNERLIVSKVGVSNGPLSTVVTTGGWTFVAIAFDSDATTGNVTYYENGSYSTGDYNIDFNDGAGSIYIGRYSTTGYFDGKIDEVMIWKGRTLTVDNLNDLYNSGAGLFFDSFE